MREPMTADDLRAITTASAGFRGLFVHMPVTGNVVFSPRDSDELYTISEDLEPAVAGPLVVMLDGVPRLLGEVERLLARQQVHLAQIASLSQSTPLADELQGWESARAALVAEVGTLRAQVAEVTRERDEARADVVVSDERLVAVMDGTFSVGDGTAQREIERLRAEIESLAPHTRDSETEPDAEALAASVRCDCCGVTIPAGDSAVMFTDENGRECWAHYARCPEPEMWAAQCADGDGEWYPIYRSDALPDEVPVVEPYEDAWLVAWNTALSVGGMLGGVRLVRVRKEPADV